MVVHASGRKRWVERRRSDGATTGDELGRVPKGGEDDMRSPIERVLLVDDDEVSNLHHKRLLRRTGLVGAINTARNGWEALETLRESLTSSVPDTELILLDIHMPRMSGFEFLEDYACLPEPQRAAQTVVMLSTSLNWEDQARAAEDPHVFRFLSKPLIAPDVARLAADISARRAMSGM